MTKDNGGDPRTPQGPGPNKPIVTPENEPSALERGARIFERLARKPGRDPQ